MAEFVRDMIYIYIQEKMAEFVRDNAVSAVVSE